jgi:hypothetical protein
MTSRRDDNTSNLPDMLKLAVIEQTYPGWHIKSRGRMWSATRTTPPTPEQATAGLHHHIIQPGLDALAAVLSQQLYIAQTTRQG